MDKLLTIVVPVYKVEKYINKCLDSLIVPDDLMEQLEVIVVNDGTPDSSADMAREYEKKYPKTFRVIDKENGGHGSAWNRGLKEATGKYLHFLDSDDWFDNENFSQLISKLKNVDVDIAFSDSATCFEGTEIRHVHCFGKMGNGLIFNADDYNWTEWGAENLTNFHHCTYRTNMLKPLEPLFLEKQYYDDAILFVVPVVLSKRIIYIEGIIYNYLKGREEQTMNPLVMQKHFKDFDKVIKQQVDYVCHNQLDYRSKNIFLQHVISAMIKKQWKRLSLLPYNLSKTELRSFKRYINHVTLQIDESRLMKLYRYAPFFFYWHYVNRKLRVVYNA